MDEITLDSICTHAMYSIHLLQVADIACLIQHETLSAYPNLRQEVVFYSFMFLFSMTHIISRNLASVACLELMLIATSLVVKMLVAVFNLGLLVKHRISMSRRESSKSKERSIGMAHSLL